MRDFEGEVIEDRDDDGLEENVDLKEGGALLVQRVEKVGQRRGRRRGIVAFLRRDVWREKRVVRVKLEVVVSGM